MRVPVRNATGSAVEGVVSIACDDVRVTKKVAVPAGATAVVEMAPKEFAQLVVANPKLWWPNGYGEPTLHDLKLRLVDAAGQESDRLSQRVGLRQLSYEYLPAGEATNGGGGGCGGILVEKVGFPPPFSFHE